MKQKEKDLLLKDLCGRLTYGVKVKFGDSKPALLTVIEHDEFGWQIGSEDEFGGMITIIDNVKPYLFPISKVVEEIVTTSNKHIAVNVDFFHKNHIDYRGLIEKGLANDATGLNIY
jgi:hypothetical protein